MRTLTIVGGSKNTRHLWKDHYEEGDIWTLAYLYDEIPADLLFEIHTEEDVCARDPDRWEALADPNLPPIMMLEQHEGIPCSKRYPLYWVTLDLFPNLFYGTEPVEVFLSSCDYMMALGIYEQYERINILGFDMDYTHEWFYQRPGAYMFMGIALGRGIEVHVPAGSELLMLRKYGYESHPKASSILLKRLAAVKDAMEW